MLRGVGAAARRAARLVLLLWAAVDLSVEPALRVVAVLVRDLEDVAAAAFFAERFFLSGAVFFAEAESEAESEDAPEATCAAMPPADQASERQIKNVRRGRNFRYSIASLSGRASCG